MIYDKIKNADKYLGISKNLDKALSLLLDGSLYTLPEGKRVLSLDDDNVFVNVSVGDTKDPEKMRMETHKKYIDIQCILEGEEKVALGLLEDMECIIDSNEDGDIWFHKGPYSWFPLEEGYFMLLSPHEAHGPSVYPGYGERKVKKALVKVKV